MVKVSVVIPVYNVEKYIRQCLDSVINQTSKDIEIICVDDGSTDHCAAILDDYALKDPRVKVIHKKNGGYGIAMNTGFALATGEYIGIVESDDWILPEMYETLYAEAVRDDLDFVKSNFYQFWGEHTQYAEKKNLDQYYNKVLNHSNRDIMFELPMNNWTGIYKRDFIVKNDICHNESEGASYQDQGFWIQVMSMANTGKWLDRGFYMYRRDNPGSSVKNRAKMMAIYNEHEFAEKKLLGKNLFEEIKIANYYRMRSHKINFFRLDDSLKAKYVDVIKKDYEKYKDDMKCPRSKESLEVLEWIKNLVENPKKVCAEICEEKNALAKQLAEAEKIVIYGCGKRAGSVCAKLNELGYLNKVSCSIVTNPKGDESLWGFRVLGINEFVNDNSGVLILIAVARKSRGFEEIVSMLREKKIDNYIDSEFLQSL